MQYSRGEASGGSQPIQRKKDDLAAAAFGFEYARDISDGVRTSRVDFSTEVILAGFDVAALKCATISSSWSPCGQPQGGH